MSLNQRSGRNDAIADKLIDVATSNIVRALAEIGYSIPELKSHIYLITAIVSGKLNSTPESLAAIMSIERIRLVNIQIDSLIALAEMVPKDGLELIRRKIKIGRNPDTKVLYDLMFDVIELKSNYGLTSSSIKSLVTVLHEQTKSPFAENNYFRWLAQNYFSSFPTGMAVESIIARTGEFFEFLTTFPSYMQDFELREEFIAAVVDYFQRRAEVCTKRGSTWQKLITDLDAFLSGIVIVEEFNQVLEIKQTALGNLTENHQEAPKIVDETTITVNEQQLVLTPEGIFGLLVNLVANSDLDASGRQKVLGRLNRGSLIENIIATIKAMVADTGNLQKLSSLAVNSRGRIRLIDSFGGNSLRGGERAAICINIDNGLNNGQYEAFCTVVFLVEFTGEENELNIHVMPFQSPGSAEESAVTEIAIEQQSEQTRVDGIPNKLVDFLMKNPLFEFDWESGNVDRFVEELAFFVCSLLEKPFYSDIELRQLAKELLKICLEDSRLKESLTSQMGNYLTTVEYSPKNNAKRAVEKYPRIIAKQLLHYLAQIVDKNTATYDEGFTQEAKNIIESHGIPDKSTASKSWVIRTEYRLQICVVSGYVIPVVTWHNH